MRPAAVTSTRRMRRAPRSAACVQPNHSHRHRPAALPERLLFFTQKQGPGGDRGQRHV